MAFDTLIHPGDLFPHLGAADWAIFDCRFSLLDPGAGERDYAANHIPGAHYAHLDRELSALASPEKGRHPLPSGEVFSAWLASHGVTPQTQVVAYDEAGGMFASRLWFMLRAMRHESVAVLDGGLAEWRSRGFPLTAQAPEVTPGNFQGTFDQARIIGVEELLPIHNNPELLLIDARTEPRYEGREEPIDPVAGHIPGARCLPPNGNLDDGGRFISPQALRARFRIAEKVSDPRQVIHYCGSGVAACHNFLAMTVAGFSLGRVFIGSWSQWCADETRPVATGNTP